MSRNSPLLAFNCFVRAFKLLPHPELRNYLLIPLLINIVLYSCALVLGYFTVSSLIQQLIPDWLSWLSWILWPLFFLSFLVIGFFTFTLLANLIAAPYYSQLSARTWQLIANCPVDSVEQPWNQVFLGELKRIGYLLTRLLPLGLLSLIPVINVAAPLLWAVFAAWGMAMEFMAYPLEHRGMAFPEQKRFLQQSPLTGLTFGALTSLGLALPGINFLIGQTAVIAATLMVHDGKGTEDQSS